MEDDQYNSEDEIDRSVPVTPRRLSEHLDHNPGMGSFAWNHFTKDADFKNNKKATCNRCSKTYICSGSSTSGITKHLKNIHGIIQQNSSEPTSEINVLNMLQSQASKVIIFSFFFINFKKNFNNKPNLYLPI